MSSNCVSSPLVSRPSRERRGITLMEMMIVIGIIAILISLLLPMAGRARQSARSVKCASNLHSIFAAAQALKTDKNRANVQALGWMQQLFPYVNKDLSLFQCPESQLVLAVSDSAGTYSSTASSSAAPTAPATSSTNVKPVDFGTAYIHIDAGGGATWDVPIAASPWMHATASGPDTTDFWLEDMGFQGGGDRDFLDVGLRVTAHPDGTSTLTILPQPAGKRSGYISSLVATSPTGAVTLLPDLYKSGAQAGASVNIEGTPTDPTGSVASAAAAGNSTGTATFSPGTSAPADYGFNSQSDKVYGNPQKVLASDYTNSIVDTSVDNWSDSKWQSASWLNTPVFARHIGRANVLYGSGAVESAPVTNTTLNPGFGSNRADFWEP